MMMTQPPVRSDSPISSAIESSIPVLPTEIWLEIIGNLDLEDIWLRIRPCCRLFHAISTEIAHKHIAHRVNNLCSVHSGNQLRYSLFSNLSKYSVFQLHTFISERLSRIIRLTQTQSLGPLCPRINTQIYSWCRRMSFLPASAFTLRLRCLGHIQFECISASPRWPTTESRSGLQIPKEDGKCTTEHLRALWKKMFLLNAR